MEPVLLREKLIFRPIIFNLYCVMYFEAKNDIWVDKEIDSRRY